MTAGKGGQDVESADSDFDNDSEIDSDNSSSDKSGDDTVVNDTLHVLSSEHSGSE